MYTFDYFRYAQQARTIVNVARINEDPNAAIIRGTYRSIIIYNVYFSIDLILLLYADLRAQIEQLHTLLQSSGGGQTNENSSQVKLLQEKLTESEKLMMETTQSWQEKLRQSEARKQEELERLRVRRRES